MNDIQMKDWESRQAKGMIWFIFINGVLAWGITTAIAFCLCTPLINEEASFMTLLPQAIITFPLAGIFWGGFMWSLGQRRYSKAQEAGTS
ncbi:MAG: hypothetical protein ACI97A_000779 [Planctomycetota bacterium]|jgi:hypothetical protein